MLTRISEIIHHLEPIYEGEAFFEFWSSIENSPIKKKVFEDIERHLEDVDEEQWKSFLPRVVDRFKNREVYRGWQQAFDVLPEAVAFSILKRNGFSDIRFLPLIENLKTPDLIAKRGSTLVAIEVKSINPSEDEIQARRNMTARRSGQPLNEKFFSKLQSTLSFASKQLATQQSDEKMIFLFLDFDDSLSEYVVNDLTQIRYWLHTHEMLADKYFIYSHPAYYFASVNSVPPHLIVWPPDNGGVVAREIISSLP